MTWEQKRHRFVNEDEILIHPFRIDRTLKHQQVFRANDAMLHSGLNVKLTTRPEHFDRKRLLVRGTPQDKTRTLRISRRSSFCSCISSARYPPLRTTRYFST